MISTTMAPLAKFQRWICWTFEHDPNRPQKPRKRAVNPRNGHFCKPQDPATWCTYAEALAAAQQRGHGVGFVFQEGDGLFFLDMDNCLQEDGQWSPLARHLMEVWQGHAAIEVSQSGRGLHVFGYASQIPPHGCRNIPLGLELYHHERFVAFTDAQSCGAIDADVSAILASVIDAYFPKTSQSRDVVDWTDEGDGAQADDEELLQIMLHSGQKTAGAFFNDKHVSFADLWNANADALAKRWPSSNGVDSFDRSEADSALASHLAYWCGGNCERMERFMRRSALVRDKWDSHGSYMERTILGACATVRNRATPREVAPALTVASTIQGAPGMFAAEMQPRTGTTFLSFSEQREYFKGCVWVQELNQTWSPSMRATLDKARFDVAYGGLGFSFTEDGKSTKSAWDAFTIGQGNRPPVARNVCFRPHLQPGAITNDGLLNTYVPEHTLQTPGDPTKFLAHLAKLFPDPTDRAVYTSYLARIVRSPGVKAQWWPIIQGAQGNGKTILNLVARYAIGDRYSHQARASALAKTGMQFNEWVTGKLYLGLEEVRVTDQRHFLEDFKDIVTNTMAAIEGKGKNQRTGDNYLNGQGFTNWRNGLPVGDEDRRYAIFFTPHQCKADIVRDGMGGEYFPDLYDWLNGRNAYADQGADYGFRVVNWWLREAAEIDARFDPQGLAQRAPETSATASAIELSRGFVEQDILERAAQGELGFAGGWIGGPALDRVLQHHRVRMTHTSREEMLATLGYQTHPALPNGRTLRGVHGQGAHVKLYLRQGHLALGLSDPEAVTQAYEKAQGGPDGNAAARALVA